GGVAPDGTLEPMQLDSALNLKVTVASGTIIATNPSVGPNGVTAPADSTEIGFINGGGNLTGVSPTNPLPVTATVTFPTEQNVNLNQVGGSAISIGQQLSAASLPVVLPAAQITTL